MTTEGIGKAPTILVLTVIAYCAAFAFDAAYLSKFGIPIQLAQVDLRALLICAASVGISFMLLLDSFAKLWPRHLPDSAQSAIRDVFFFAGAVICAGLIVGPGNWKFWLVLLAVAAVFAFFKVGWPLIHYRDWQKVAAALEAWKRNDSDRGLHEILYHFVPDPALVKLMSMGLTAIFVAAALGSLLGAEQEVFLVAESWPRCVVLREDGERFLCAVFNIDSHTTTGQYRFITRDEVLERKRIGHLTVADMSAPPARSKK